MRSLFYAHLFARIGSPPVARASSGLSKLSERAQAHNASGSREDAPHHRRRGISALSLVKTYQARCTRRQVSFEQMAVRARLFLQVGSEAADSPGCGAAACRHMSLETGQFVGHSRMLGTGVGGRTESRQLCQKPPAVHRISLSQANKVPLGRIFLSGRARTALGRARRRTAVASLLSYSWHSI